MPLAVRRVKVTDLPVLESLELETTKRFPSRTRWMETYRALLERALSEEPEGLLVADYDGRAVGAVIARVRGTHPLTGASMGVIEALTVAPAWRTQGVSDRLLAEAQAYLKSRGCQIMAATLEVDAGADAQPFQTGGFRVAGWTLEKAL